MSKSTINTTANGKLAATSVDANLDPDLMGRIGREQAKLGKSKSAQATIKREIAELEIQLNDNPIFQKIQKLKRKYKVAKQMETEAAIAVNTLYEEATRDFRKGRRMIDMFDELIEDTPQRARKALKR